MEGCNPRCYEIHIWLKNNFENFHELDYDVLVKLHECWWKVNAHEAAPFTRTVDFGREPYANVKTEKTHDHYLDTNQIFGRTNGASNVDDTQEDQGHGEVKEDLTLEQSICKIRRFEMMKLAKVRIAGTSSNFHAGPCCKRNQLIVIMESLVKKKQKGVILELKRRHLKNTIFCTYTAHIQQGRYGVSAPAQHKKHVLINSRCGVSTASLYVVCIAVHQSKIRI
ncbi:hypothetical protein Tco_1160270 [Tanacetum coccineum]